MDIDVRIRHGISLMLYNMTRHVTMQAVNQPQLERPVLEALELKLWYTYLQFSNNTMDRKHPHIFFSLSTAVVLHIFLIA